MLGWKQFDAVLQRPTKAVDLRAWRIGLAARTLDELQLLLDQEHQHLGWTVIRYASCLLALIVVAGDLACHVRVLNSATSGQFTPAWVSTIALVLVLWFCVRRVIASRYRARALFESLRQASIRSNAARGRRP
jgi:hypothetical protein